MPARSYAQYCPIAFSLDHVGRRWTLLVIRELILGPLRYNDIKEALPGIATNLLTERLRDLEADGLVERRVLPSPANVTVYALTPMGTRFRGLIFELMRLGVPWMPGGKLRHPPRHREAGLLLQALLGTVAPRRRRARVHVQLATGSVGVDVHRGAVAVSMHVPTDPDATIVTSASALTKVVNAVSTMTDAMQTGLIRAGGNPSVLRMIGQLVDQGVSRFRSDQVFGTLGDRAHARY